MDKPPDPSINTLDTWTSTKEKKNMCDLKLFCCWVNQSFQHNSQIFMTGLWQEWGLLTLTGLATFGGGAMASIVDLPSFTMVMYESNRNWNNNNNTKLMLTILECFHLHPFCPQSHVILACPVNCKKWPFFLSMNLGFLEENGIF